MNVVRRSTVRPIAGIVLAAGGGSRMGQPKGLLAIDGRALVTTHVNALAEGGCSPIAVVVGAESKKVSERVGDGATVVFNPMWDMGLRTSLYAGLRSLQHGSAGAALVSLVDQPGISAAAVDRLATAWGCAGRGVAAVVATYDGLPRNPVILARRIWAEVTIQAGADEGARAWLRQNPSRVLEVECGDVADGTDLDTPADLERWKSELG